MEIDDSIFSNTDGCIAICTMPVKLPSGSVIAAPLKRYGFFR